MTPPVTALTGLSGVGKSTCLQMLAVTLRFQHLQASALIQAARQSDEYFPTADDLRLENLDENQRLLIQGFANAADKHADLIVLDAHTVIELSDRDRQVPIEPDVFRAIGIGSMIFLSDDCAEIAKRRLSDKARQRQIKSVDELREVQSLAVQHATYICRALAVPLSIVESCDHDVIAKLLLTHGAVGLSNPSTGRR